MKLGDKVSKLGNPFKRAFSVISTIAEQADLGGDSRKQFNGAIAALFFAVIRADGEVAPVELEQIGELFEQCFGRSEGRRLRDEIGGREAIDVSDECRHLGELGISEKQEIIQSLVEVAAANNEFSPEKRAVIEQIAGELEVEATTVSAICDFVSSERRRRAKMVKSGAGVGVALVVIMIFILTATFLKSVLFGLMLAYFCLPLQRWYHTRFFPGPIGQMVCIILAGIVSPFRRVATTAKSLVSRSASGSVEPAPEVLEREQRDKRARQACHATLITLIVAVVLITLAVTWISAIYVTGVHKSVVAKLHDTGIIGEASQSEPDESASADGVDRATESAVAGGPSVTDAPAVVTDEDGAKVTAEDPAGWKKKLAGLAARLERLQPEIEKLPGFIWARDTAAAYLKDEENRGKLLVLIVSKSGGVLTVVTSFVGNIASFLLNVMLTLFFFTFFLQKIALYNSQGPRRKTTGRYLVESIFRSRWLPVTSPEARNEARTIIDDIIRMLQTWVRGYLWIIIIEASIYTFVFMLLRLPYFPVLGIVAGLTILLPFLGPIASALLTITVTYAVGQPSVLLVLIIVLIYFIINGIIEQLFLYPGFVGEALGMNVLETIIVVLIGGLVAGLAGVIFAVPAASIMKYLIPKLYQSIPHSQEAAGAAESA